MLTYHIELILTRILSMYYFVGILHAGRAAILMEVWPLAVFVCAEARYARRHS